MSPDVHLVFSWLSPDLPLTTWPSSDLQLVSTPMSDPAGLYCAVLCCTRAIYCTVHNEQSCFYSMFFFEASYFEGSFSFTSWGQGKVRWWSGGQVRLRWVSGDGQVNVKSQSELDIGWRETCFFLLLLKHNFREVLNIKKLKFSLSLIIHYLSKMMLLCKD